MKHDNEINFYFGPTFETVRLIPLPLPVILSFHLQMAQSVYGLVEEGTQSRSPVHTPSHHCRKGTKEDVEKEVDVVSHYVMFRKV